MYALSGLYSQLVSVCIFFQLWQKCPLWHILLKLITTYFHTSRDVKGVKSDLELSTYGTLHRHLRDIARTLQKHRANIAQCAFLGVVSDKHLHRRSVSRVTPKTLPTTSYSMTIQFTFMFVLQCFNTQTSNAYLLTHNQVSKQTATASSMSIWHCQSRYFVCKWSTPNYKIQYANDFCDTSCYKALHIRGRSCHSACRDRRRAQSLEAPPPVL